MKKGDFNKKRVLVIDALNMYFRAYIVDPSLSTNGQPIGGMKGFLKILNKLVRETKPDKVVVCWDGPGGSRKRKTVNKNYKEGRSPIRLNRDIRNLSESEETANKIWQQTRLFEYLNQMPIVQFIFESVEADDVISHVVQSEQLKGWQKVIVSSDKDFFQLLDDETILYRPVQKEVLNRERIVENFGIHPTNFALARAVVGDKSDNLDGIRGVGLSTVSKRFPAMAEAEAVSIDELIESAESVESNLRCYQNIIDGRDTITQNYKLMQLYSPALSVQAKQVVKETLRDFILEVNKTEIRKMFVQDGMGELQLSDLFQAFARIISDTKRAPVA